mmetsp:Transcript_17182/g.37357  ORF Transcript_17182/g.37357 Transcript_17182/m.37357 type:complete len:460 (-) Transcript_17182:52-1431(-)
MARIKASRLAITAALVLVCLAVVYGLARVLTQWSWQEAAPRVDTVSIVDAQTDIVLALPQVQRPQHGDPGAQRKGSGARRRIGLVSAFRFDDDRHKLFVREGFPNKQCYAERHGYDNIFVTSYEGLGRTPPEKGAALSEQDKWRSSWAKIVLAQQHLPYYDWILICDGDFFILNYSRPLESFIEEFERSEEDIHVFVPRDFPFENYFSFSMWAMLVRNTPLMNEMMSEWISSRFTCEEAMWWAEQPHCYVALARAIRRFHDLPTSPDTDCARYCPAGVSGRLPEPRLGSTGSLRGLQLNISRCLDAIGNELELPVGHYNTELKGPAVWSWGPSHHKFPERDVGLGVNLLFSISTNLYAIRHAFGVHAKPQAQEDMAETVAQLQELELDQRYEPVSKLQQQAWYLIKERWKSQAQQDTCLTRFANMDDDALLEEVERSETLSREWFAERVRRTRQEQLKP